MLPILRILPVGGVLLAIFILALALTPPGAGPLPSSMTGRGPTIDIREYAEQRQVMMQAALRRAEELIRLRDLPDTPTRTEAPLPTPLPEAAAPSISETPAAPTDAAKIAGLPIERMDAEPDADSITGSIEETAPTIPIEIGETSSTELPVVLPEERPPVIRTPERTKPMHDSRRKRPVRAARAKTKQPQTPAAQIGFFEALFGRPSNHAPVYGTAQNTVVPAPAIVAMPQPPYRPDAPY